jgi:hypothetical protein
MHGVLLSITAKSLEAKENGATASVAVDSDVSQSSGATTATAVTSRHCSCQYCEGKTCIQANYTMQ